MFDFIIIIRSEDPTRSNEQQNENKGAFLFRYEIIGQHAFYPTTGWRVSWQMEYDTQRPSLHSQLTHTHSVRAYVFV